MWLKKEEVPDVIKKKKRFLMWLKKKRFLM